MIILKPNLVYQYKLYFDCFMTYLQDIGLFNRISSNPKAIPTDKLYNTLSEEGNLKLINLLKKVDSKEPGYGTVIVPKGGFSLNTKTHAMVICWLKDRNINIVDVDKEISDLENSLRRDKE